MDTLYENIRIFLSSPGDTVKERQICDEVIRSADQVCRQTLRLFLEPVRWENLPPRTPAPSEGSIQAQLNRQIRDCQFFVLVLNRRYGTREAGESKSNTEREVDEALKILKTNKKMTILAYFKENPNDSDPGQQLLQLADLKQRLLSEEKVFYKPYANAADFERKFTHDLYNLILRYRHSTFKHEMIRSVLRLGHRDSDRIPRLAIIYPPVPRKYMGGTRGKNLWHERLAPNLSFEDFKLIEKVIKNLRLVGFHEYQVIPTQMVSTEQDSDVINHFWLCLPRNKQGMQQLRQYSHVCRFQFEVSDNGDRRILWRYNESSHGHISIESPMAKYLKLQRVRDTGDWSDSLGRVITKDFAVFARFPNANLATDADDPPYDYFATGIRGLGTWGVGWYLDRRYPEFAAHKDKDEFQILLEVTFENNKIVSARDVSSEPQAYFSEQTSTKYVKSTIAAFKSRNGKIEL